MSLLPEKVASQIRSEIAKGTYSQGTRLEPVRELCEKYGVSRRTINSALEALENDGFITKLPRRGIEVVKNLPEDMNGTNVSAGKVMYVRLRQDDLSYAITMGLQRCAHEHNENPIIIDALGSHETFLNAFRYLRPGIKGMLLQIHDHPDFLEVVTKDYESGVRIVCIGRVISSFNFSSVTSDNFSGGYQATDHLLAVHERPVFHITYRDAPSSARDRRQGWARAMRLHGFDDCQDYLLVMPCSEYEVLIEGEPAIEKNSQAIFSLIQAHRHRKLSVFAVNDAIAREVYKSAERLNLQVGKDVFVVGFDNLPFGKRLSPPLSSVFQSVEQVGYEGAKLLYEEIEGNLTQPIHKVLPTYLEIRASSTG